MKENYNYETVNFKDTSLNDFNRFVRAWKLDFIQLKPGPFTANISQIIYPDLQLGHAMFNTTVKQEGFAPDGVWTFAFVNEVKIYWRNYNVQPNSIIIYAPGSEINAVSESDFEVLTFSISDRFLFDIAKQVDMIDFYRSLKSIDLLNSKDPFLWSELRMVILEEINTHLQIQNYRRGNSFKESFTKKLVTLLKESDKDTIKVSGDKRLNLLQEAEQYIVQNITEPITVSALSSYLKVSERTLQYAFKNRFNMGPKAFMLILKLNHVHHRLLENENNKSIASIARESGFWHMGQFNKDYKKFFGELPSVTVKTNLHEN